MCIVHNALLWNECKGGSNKVIWRSSDESKKPITFGENEIIVSDTIERAVSTRAPALGVHPWTNELQPKLVSCQIDRKGQYSKQEPTHIQNPCFKLSVKNVMRQETTLTDMS